MTTPSKWIPFTQMKKCCETAGRLLMQNSNRGVVMIVDDVESEIDILVDILHKEYEVCVAMDGESALEAAAEVGPDLILLDVLMPGMDGYEVCRRLKQNPKTMDISIIFVTVLSEEGHEATGLELGALDYITKPFNRDIVLARVRNHMDLIEAHRLKEDVKRIVTHDMRNELNMIIGLPDILLRDDNLSPRQREMLEKIRKSGYALLNMVNLELQLYKMERGLYDFIPSNVDALNVLRRIIEHKASIQKQKSIEVKMTLAGRQPVNGEPFFVRSEELLLYCMLSNLVANAIEASPAGGEVAIDMADADSSRIVIHNMGAVPVEIRDRFFKKFVTAGKSCGTGLGTYSALLMARAHGGAIEMETSEEKGTTVSVLLPKG